MYDHLENWQEGTNSIKCSKTSCITYYTYMWTFEVSVTSATEAFVALIFFNFLNNKYWFNASIFYTPSCIELVYFLHCYWIYSNPASHGGMVNQKQQHLQNKKLSERFLCRRVLNAFKNSHLVNLQKLQ